MERALVKDNNRGNFFRGDKNRASRSSTRRCRLNCRHFRRGISARRSMRWSGLLRRGLGRRGRGLGVRVGKGLGLVVLVGREEEIWRGGV